MFFFYQELHSLGELFTVGQVLPCVCIGETPDSKLIQLSINPKALHEHLSPQCLHLNLVRQDAILMRDHCVYTVQQLLALALRLITLADS